MSPTIVGDVVKFTDDMGRKFNALVIYVHSEWPLCLNIAYVDIMGSEDSYGRIIKRTTSIPCKAEGMTGFYFEP